MTAEELLASLAAEAKLADLDLYSDVAELWETESCEKLRRFFADQYRRYVGVPPERRAELQAGLELIQAGNGMPVEALLDIVNHH